MNGDFIQRLRMQNIFGGERPLGMPDFESGSFDPMQAFNRVMQMRNAEKIDELNRAAFDEFRAGFEGRREAGTIFDRPSEGMPTSRVAEIGKSMAQPQPINYAFQPSMTDYQKAQIALGRERLASQEDIAAGKAGISQQNVDVSKQRAAIQDFKAKNPGLKVITPKGGNIQFMNPISGEVTDSGISTGTMTESELQELRGEQAIEQIGARGDIVSRQIGERGAETRKTAELTGEQALGEIAARIAGERGKPLQPTQEKARVQNAYQKLITTRPDLAEFVVTDPNTGTLSIKEGTSQATTDMINNALFGKAGGDVELKPEKEEEEPKKKTKKEEPKSKYQVTVK